MTQAAASALDPREILRADASSERPVIADRLVRFCFNRSRDRERAKDLASEAIVLTLAAEGWHRWKYDGHSEPAASLLMHLCNIAKDVLKKERESAAAWREVEGDAERDAAAPDSKPPPGEMRAEWAKHDDGMRRAGVVMDRLDEDTRRMLQIESESDEDLDAATLAERLGWTTKQVYRARERVLYHRELVLSQETRQKKGGGS